MDSERQRQPGPRRIGLIGAECTGKSSLAEALGRVLPACVVDEELRHFVEEAGRTPNAAEQQGILRRQAEREQEVAAMCTRPWLVADPAPLMTAIYSVEYFDDDSLLDEAITHARGHDLLVWCAPDLPWVADDGMRDGPDRRASTEATIARIIEATAPALLPPIVRATGDAATRLRCVTAEVNPSHTS